MKMFKIQSSFAKATEDSPTPNIQGNIRTGLCRLLLMGKDRIGQVARCNGLVARSPQINSGRSIFKAALAGVIVLSLLTSAKAAPTSVALAIYPLTNSLAGTTNYISLTNGNTLIGTGAVYTVTSQPFQVWRGRGFSFNAGIVGTNANTGNLAFTFRFAPVHYLNYQSGNSAVTNWSTANNLTIAVPATGTTEQFWWTNIQPTVVDNMTLGQLVSITNNSPNGINIDPTNTFIGVYP